MLPAVTFIGDPEREHVARSVAREFQKRGLRVGYLRERGVPRREEKLEFPGMLEVYSDGLFFHQEGISEGFEHLVFRFFPDYDLVVAEGFAEEELVPKVEVALTGGPLLRGQVPGVLAVVTEAEVEGVQCFGPEEIPSLVDYLEEAILRPFRKAGHSVLFVNGRRIPMKKYVQETLAGVVEGFVSRLKMTEGAQEIEVRIILEKNPEK